MSPPVIVLQKNQTVELLSGSNTVFGAPVDQITIDGGGNFVVLAPNSSLTINDNRTASDGFTGAFSFGDTIITARYDTITLNYCLTLGNSDTVSVDFSPAITAAPNDLLKLNYSVYAGKADKINFAGSNQSVLLYVGAGDTITTSGSNDTITIGGTAATKSTVTVAVTAPGTTINGGLGIDTFTAGSGYSGGNNFVGSAHGYQDGFNGIGSCANYANLDCRVTVNLDSNIGQGFDAAGNLLWTDSYSSIQQVKAARRDGNVLTGSDSYYCELKGGLGQFTAFGGAAGDRIIWSSAGLTRLLDGQAADIAYAGNGPDEFYWRNSPGGKGVSNLGETIYGFDPATGDDLNLSEFASSGFAGVSTAFTFDDLSGWVGVSLSADGRDTDVWFDRTGSGNFTQLAAVLKNTNLFSIFGVSDQSSAGAQQVVQDLYNTGQLVLTQPH